MSPLELPTVAVPSPDLPVPFPSAKVIHDDGRCTVYFQRGGTVRSKRVSLATFNADRKGFYSRWKNEG